MNYFLFIGIGFVLLGAFIVGFSIKKISRLQRTASVVFFDYSGDQELSKAVKAEADKWANGRQYTVRLNHDRDGGWDAAGVILEHSDVIRTLNTRGSSTPIQAVQEVMKGLGLHRS